MIKLLILHALLSSPINYNIDLNQAKMLQGDIASILKVPVVVLVHEFNSGSVDQFSDDIQRALNTKQPIIPILIDSYGGSIYAFLRMYDTLKAINVPIATICLGKCMSAGILLLSTGTNGYRWAAPNSTLLIHDAASSMEGKVTEMHNEMQELERLNQQIFSILAKQSGRQPEFFVKKLKEKGNVDWYLGPVEAKELGIINMIGLPIIKLKVKTEMILE